MRPNSVGCHFTINRSLVSPPRTKRISRSGTQVGQIRIPRWKLRVAFHLADVGATLADDVLMELLEDVHFSLIVAGDEILVHLLQVPETLVHIRLGAAQRHHLRLLPHVGEGDLHLVEFVADLFDLAALSADDGLVKALLNDDVSCLLVFLKYTRSDEKPTSCATHPRNGSFLVSMDKTHPHQNSPSCEPFA